MDKARWAHYCWYFSYRSSDLLGNDNGGLSTRKDRGYLLCTFWRGKFTKLDFSYAYLQLLIGDSIRPLMTINTHKSLLTLWGPWTRLSVQKFLLFFPKKKKKIGPTRIPTYLVHLFESPTSYQPGCHVWSEL